MPKQCLNPGLFVGKALPEHAEYTIVRPLDEGLDEAVFVAHAESSFCGLQSATQTDIPDRTNPPGTVPGIRLWLWRIDTNLLTTG